MTDIDRKELNALLDAGRQKHKSNLKSASSDTALRYYQGTLAAIEVIQKCIDDGTLDVKVSQVPIREINPETKLKVRRNAPGTSFDAAVSISRNRSLELFLAIHDSLTIHGPQTDDQLRAHLSAWGILFEKTSVTKRRKELVDAGWVRDSCTRRKSDRGTTTMIVWEAVLPQVRS